MLESPSLSPLSPFERWRRRERERERRFFLQKRSLAKKKKKWTGGETERKGWLGEEESFDAASAAAVSPHREQSYTMLGKACLLRYILDDVLRKVCKIRKFYTILIYEDQSKSFFLNKSKTFCEFC